MKEGNIHGFGGQPSANQNPAPVGLTTAVGLLNGAFMAGNLLQRWRNSFQQQNQGPAPRIRRVFLVDFNGSEGLYLDSKTVTFSATWKLITVFSEILLASGLWKKVPGHNERLWSTSVKNISGDVSWLSNRLDPADDVIVDFGS